VKRIGADDKSPRSQFTIEQYRGSSMNNLNQLAGWKEMFHIVPPILLRLIVGYGFMEHGFAKLARGPDAFPAILQGLGVPFAHFMAWSTIAVEILGGLAVLLGAFVALASLPMAAVLVVAMFTVHLRYGFSSIKLMAVTAAGPQFGPPGIETNLLYLACLAALAIGGSGPLAIDALLRKKQKSRSQFPRSGATASPERSYTSHTTHMTH
jgi:putative oxidoreductase